MPPAPPPPVKHRACDECRTRKLACSKDAEGCERCKKEGIICHYSEQKTMGRPRKRQFVEVVEPEQSPEGSTHAPYIINAVDVYNKQGNIDPQFMEGFFQVASPLNPTGFPQTLNKHLDDTSDKEWTFGSGNYGAGPPITFEDPLVPTVDATPQLSNESNTSSSDYGSSSADTVPCSCLASMYLALSSLQQLPADVAEALKTVRSACKTASYTIWCPQCGSVVLEQPSPSMDSFQNTMLLGTLLPLIANAYRKLLDAIDDETNAAEAAGQSKMFQFHEYGGLCGNQATVQETLMCGAKELFFNPVEMAPQQWRTTVRALLRVDIYGHEQGGFKHKGLKDLVSDMEARQKGRHEMVHAHALAGNVDNRGHGFFGQDCNAVQPGGMHTCLQVLSIAKLAIDNLVIA